jgi:hypothetical protein
LRPAGTHRLAAGAIDLVAPRIGAIHRVCNALAHEVPVGIHV